MKTFDIAELQTRMAYWQRCLRLLDWDIDLRISDRHDMPTTTCLGASKWVLETRQAWIRILQAEDIAKSDPPADRDQEVTLVHELVHVVLARVNAGEIDEVSLEQSIDSLARALISLERRSEA